MTKAFLALWNDFPTTLREEYETWHTFEHVPERLTPPGIRAARRYAAFGTVSDRYFTLYELDDTAALEHPDYLDLVRCPTPWSLKMREHFSNVLRIPAECIASGGRGIGSHMLVKAYSVDRSHADGSSNKLALVLQDLVSSGRILSYRIGLAEPNQKYEVFEQEPQPDTDMLNVVVLAESSSRGGLEQARPGIAVAANDILQPRANLREGLLELLVSFHDGEVPTNRSEIRASETMRSRFTEGSWGKCHPAQDRKLSAF
ncbi:hypothetical protein QWE_06981 [Agrobacterium albertimagni AOL15]|uniref:Uncharacterized protein n=1 Tax=Agrobacterium albertimagni AOL15 TaxID=1156935 RepID=K2QGX8_9HYPH|nr:hypothetical protein [Agrobacterium albertimagni]EKF60331.1 hypothetical protein QWE_06981 [Agrobacterium albertimagni AOL15]